METILHKSNAKRLLEVAFFSLSVPLPLSLVCCVCVCVLVHLFSLLRCAGTRVRDRLISSFGASIKIHHVCVPGCRPRERANRPRHDTRHEADAPNIMMSPTTPPKGGSIAGCVSVPLHYRCCCCYGRYRPAMAAGYYAKHTEPRDSGARRTISETAQGNRPAIWVCDAVVF